MLASRPRPRSRFWGAALVFLVVFVRCSDPSGPDDGDGDEPEIPAAPANLAAAVGSSDSLRLTWTDRSDDEDGFVIRRGIGGGALVERARVGANVTHFDDTGLTSDTEYAYNVCAFNDAGVSACAARTVTTQAVPAIHLNTTSIMFAATEGGDDPTPSDVAVSNSGSGTLDGLSATVVYTAGEATDWLEVELSGTSAPTSLTVAPITAGLEPGVWTATVNVASPAATNSPASVTVSFTIEAVAEDPAIELSETSVAFEATVGGADPANIELAVTNGGGGTLDGLSADVTFVTGEPGWLSVMLSSMEAPATLTLMVATTGLEPGSYTATIAVASPVSPNTPQSIEVTLEVHAVETPLIALSDDEISFAADEGGADPAVQSIDVTNGGGGTLSGLAAVVEYDAGEPTGWLSASLTGALAPATLALDATTLGLEDGTYHATVHIESAVAGNSPRDVAVTFEVVAESPVIVLSAIGATFDALVGDADPPAQTIEITNGGGGSLEGLGAQVAPGDTWLTAGLSGTTAPATLTLSVSIAGLDAGVHTTTVEISSPDAPNSPLSVDVLLRLADPEGEPVIVLSDDSLAFNAQAGGTAPAAQIVDVTNGNDGRLGGLVLVLDYADGQPTGWLTAVLSADSAPASLTVTPNPTGLAAGVYDAVINVVADALNSPQSVAVTFTVEAEEAPVIVLSEDSLVFSGQQGSPDDPVPQTVDISNGGGGTLDGLIIVLDYAPGEETGWLNVDLTSDVAPATLTLTPRVGGLLAGDYHVVVGIGAPDAANTPQGVAVTVTVEALEAPVIVLSATDITFTATAGQPNPAPQQVTVTNGGGGTLGIGTTIRYDDDGATGWLDAIPASTIAPDTLSLGVHIEGMIPGTYGAEVDVTSATAGNSPQTIDITLNVNIAPGTPAPPYNAQATAAGELITLLWSDTSTIETQFWVDLSTSPTFAAFESFSFGANSPGGLFLVELPFTTYYLRVRATNAFGSSVYSNVASATTGAAELAWKATADNAIAFSSTDGNVTNTSYPNDYVSVGCNFSIGEFFSAYLCAGSLIAFNSLDVLIQGRSIASATLLLWVEALPADINTVYTAAAISQNWFSNVTWSTQPFVYTANQVLFEPPVTAAVPIELDVTGIVRAWASGAFVNYGIMLFDNAATLPPISLLQMTSFQSRDPGLHDFGQEPEIHIEFN